MHTTIYLLALSVQLASAKEKEYRLDFQFCLSIWFCERAYASPVVCPRIHLAECLRGPLPQTSHYAFFLFYFLFHDLLIGHSLVEFLVGHLTGPFVFEKDVFTRCRPALQEVEEKGVKQMAGGEGERDQQNVALDVSSFLVLRRFIAIHIRILLN